MNRSIKIYKDELFLLARVLLMVLFALFGLQKLAGVSGTVGYMTSVGARAISAVINVVMELVTGISIIISLCAHPLASLNRASLTRPKPSPALSRSPPS